MEFNEKELLDFGLRNDIMDIIGATLKQQIEEMERQEILAQHPYNITKAANYYSTYFPSIDGKRQYRRRRTRKEIEDLIEKQTNPTVAPYAKLGEVHLRVTAKATSEEEAKKFVAPVTEELYRRFGHKIFTTKEDETLEDVVVNMLSKHHYTIAAAESCTAGMFTARLVNVAGASDVLNESFITYANEAKMKYLGVKEETLNTVGAVSEETAKQMAEGVAKRAGSNVGVGITGLAGPGGETPEKKAGLVYISVSVNGKTKVSKYQFNGNRQKVRQMAVCRALMMVRHALVEEFFEKDWKK